MTRAAVLIGVNRTGGLPALADAVAGARRMEQWALDQGMARKRVLRFTDENGPVDIGDIRRAIRKLVDSGSLEQLVVYFAGHGVNIRYGEYWLLSDAPVDASAAVNVEASMVLARRCGIPHVVFISDACRTAAEGIQAQGVTGGEIFPNDPVEGPERPVDVFFGTTLGRPALEIRDPVASTGVFRALYTGVVLDALDGRLPAAALPTTDGGEIAYLVRPRRLKACLAQELPQRLAGLGLPLTVSQVPDARITSDDDAWLSRYAQPAAASGGTARGGLLGARSPVATPPPTPTAMSRARAELDTLLGDGRPAVLGAAAPRGGGVARGGEAFPARRRGAAWSGPTRFETGCGFKVVGADIAEAASAEAGVAVLGDGRALVRVDLAGPVADVLLVFGNGSAALLPALRGYVAALSIEDGELVDVAYEPSEGTPGWQAFADRAEELRTLRDAVAVAAREGVFRVEGPRAETLARRMRYAGRLDPALALYAAYAYADLRQDERIREMRGALRDSLDFSFFDLDLLAGGHPLSADAANRCHPPFPMLAQGWALLPVLGTRPPGGPLGGLPEELAALQRELLPSLWSHFSPAGARRLREIVSSNRRPQ